MNWLRTSTDAIVTVAQGREWIVAQRLAKETGLPLISFFHDWWPGIGAGGRMATTLLERRYRHLASASSIVFAISEEMQECLGRPQHSVVLYPIPGRSAHLTSRATSAGSRRLAYAGALYPIYGERIVALSEALKTNPVFDFAFAGKFPAGCEGLVKRGSATGHHAGFLKDEAFDGFIAGAAALLVLGTFETHLRRFCETNFPSKLTEYPRNERPLVIWAPEYSSSVRWARRSSAALVVTYRNLRRSFLPWIVCSVTTRSDCGSAGMRGTRPGRSSTGRRFRRHSRTHCDASLRPEQERFSNSACAAQ